MQKITVAAGLVLLLSLASCQKESVVTPDQLAIASARTASNDISSNLSQNYKLIKHGQVSLTYYADGRLKQVTAGVDVRGGLVYRREYTYDDINHLINATSYLSSKVILSDTYYLDPQTGRCHQSEQVDYTLLDKPSNLNVPLNTRWYYQYNEKGQLARCQNLFLHSSDRTEYVYNADDDLIKAVTYDRDGNQDGVPVQALTLTYNQSPLPRDTGNWLDKYPLNASWVRLPVPDESFQGQPVPEQYLPIFGKPSKHLVTGMVQMQLLSQRTLANSLFTYRLNANGYVTERKELDARGSSVLETKAYDYQVTNIGVQF